MKTEKFTTLQEVVEYINNRISDNSAQEKIEAAAAQAADRLEKATAEREEALQNEDKPALIAAIAECMLAERQNKKAAAALEAGTGPKFTAKENNGLLEQADNLFKAYAVEKYAQILEQAEILRQMSGEMLEAVAAINGIHTDLSCRLPAGYREKGYWNYEYKINTLPVCLKEVVNSRISKEVSAAIDLYRN